MTASLPAVSIDVQRLPALPAILKALRGLSQMRFAALVRITGRQWQAYVVDDQANLGIKEGDVWPIENTLCGEVLELNAPVSQPSVAVDSASDNAAHMVNMLGIRCHFSYPVFDAEGSFFGVLCMMDTTPCQPLPFAVIDAASAFSQLVGADISRARDAASSDRIAPEATAEPETAPAHGGQSPTRSDAVGADAPPSVQSRVLSVIGHDLRNPMHSLMAAIEMIQLKPMDPRLERLMGMVHGSASRLGELAQQTLDFTRLQMLGELPVQIVPSHDPAGILKSVIKTVRASYPQREVEEDIDACPTADLDPARLEQAMTSVLTHAIKHCGADQRVRVVASGGDGELEISVDVPGYILDSAMLANVFNPFAQEGGEAQTAHLGVGLYLARAIALSHGGDLIATQAGNDARFVFAVPVSSTVEA